MTRDEAKQKLRKSLIHRDNTSWSDIGIEDWLSGLEGLGLIKFDEKSQEIRKHSSEKGPYIFFPHPDGGGRDNVSVLQSDAVKTMEHYGYIVEDKKMKKNIMECRKLFENYEDFTGALLNRGYKIVKI